MNTYRAKSQQYQIFVVSEMTIVKISEIQIPKLNLCFKYNSRKLIYENYPWGSKSSELLVRSINERKQKFLKPIFYEINHFIIENELIDLLISKDELNNKLGSEILLLKLENIKL